LRWDVLEDAFSDAGFLLTQWERALVSSCYTLLEVAHGPEVRARAHLEALETGGPEVLARLCRPYLHDDDCEKVGVAASVLLARGTEHDVRAVAQALCQSEEAPRRAIARALALSERPGLAAHLLPLLQGQREPVVLHELLAVLGVRGESPGPLLLARALAHVAPEVRLAALHVARRFPTEADATAIQRELGSAVPEVRAAALVAGMIQGQRRAWRACREVSQAPDVAGRTARLLLALGGTEDEVERLVVLLDQQTLRADTLWALGFTGRVAAADACLPWLFDASVAPLAAEALSAVMGLRLEGQLVRKREQSIESDEMTPGERTPLWPALDDGLPSPVASEVERAWAGARPSFDKATRYLDGQPLTAARLVAAVAAVPMRRRAPLALELAVRTGGVCTVETRMWASMQLTQAQAASRQQEKIQMRLFAG
jgi:uncharacterized protein (TIGR02270 family)